MNKKFILSGILVLAILFIYFIVEQSRYTTYEDLMSELIAEEDFNYIQLNIAEQLGQFTLFHYRDKSYVIMTTPRAERLKVLVVEELPEEMSVFF